MSILLSSKSLNSVSTFRGFELTHSLYGFFILNFCITSFSSSNSSSFILYLIVCPGSNWAVLYAPASTDGQIPTSEAASIYLSETIHLIGLNPLLSKPAIMSKPSEATIAAGPSHGSVRNE